MRVRVLFFGQLKEITGVAQEETDLSDGARVEDLFERYGRRFPKLADFRPSIAASVNQEYAQWRAPLTNGDEVAFLPPVSGGQQTAVAEDIFQLVRHQIAPTKSREPESPGRRRARSSSTASCATISRASQTLYLEYEAYEPMAYAKMREIGARNSRKVLDSSPGHRPPPGPPRNWRDQRADRRQFGASRRGVRRLPLRNRHAEALRAHLEEGVFRRRRRLGRRRSCPPRKPFRSPGESTSR